MPELSRSQRLRAFCKGRRKGDVARKWLKIPPQHLSYMLRTGLDIDKLIARIDALPAVGTEASDGK